MDTLSSENKNNTDTANNETTLKKTVVIHHHFQQNLDILEELEQFSKKLEQRNPSSKPVLTVLEHQTHSIPQEVLDQIAKQTGPTYPQEATLRFSTVQFPEAEKRYEILETLGQGGMGIVQSAYDHLLGREVALKKIIQTSKTTSVSKQNFFCERLVQEASITSVLEHPNIIPLYEMQQGTQGEIQFTMRKVDGQSARNFLQKIKEKQVPYHETKMISIFLKICDAIAYAHSKGILHRDLKPENILIGDYGEVYVADWGVAKYIENKDLVTRKKLSQHLKTNYLIRSVGTPGYAAPEQIEDAENITTTADIYALGKILWEFFTQLSPIEEISLQCKEQFSTKRNTPFKRLEKKIIPPKDIQAIVSKATQFDPKMRYPNVQSMAQDVEHYLKNSIISAREYSFFERVYKWAKRNKKNIQMFSFALFFGIFSLYFFQKWKHQQHVQFYIQRLTTLLEELKEPKEGLREQALLEINKMDAPEILEILQQKLNEGIQYFLSETSRTATKDQYYRTIATTLGWLENPKAGPALMHALLQMQKKVQAIPSHQRPRSDEQFMADIAQAIAHSKATGYAYTLSEIRYAMEPRSVFWKNSEFALLRLIERDQIYNTPPKESKDYNARGILYFTQKKITEAIQDFSQAIQMNPKYAEAYANRALMYSKQGKPEEGLKDIQQAISFSQSNAQYYKLRGTLKETLKDFAGALEDYQRAIRYSPQNAHFYLDYAVLQIQLEQYKDALPFFDQAIQIHPLIPSAYINRGICKQYLQDFVGALADFEKAIQLDPQSAEAHSNRGAIRLQLQDFEGALTDFDQAIQLNPNHIEAYLNRGIAKKSCLDLAGAFSDFEEVIRQNPQNPEGFFWRGFLYFEQNRLEDALKDFTLAIQLNPQLEKAYVFRSVLYLNQQNFSACLADLDFLLQQNPTHAQSLFNRGILYRQLGEYEKALSDFQQYLLLEEDPDAYLEIGHLYHLQKEPQKAQQFYQIAVEKKIVLLQDDSFYQDFSRLLIQNLAENWKSKNFQEAQTTIEWIQKYFSPADPLFQKTQKLQEKINAQSNSPR